MRYYLTCVLLSLSIPAICQFPDTDIYLGDYQFKNDRLEISHLRNITNREGYDNQPFFHPKHDFLYYSSIRNDEQSDIYRYEQANGKIYKVHSSMEAEYSPQIIPGQNELSVVRVEMDQKQRLWAIDILNPESSELLFPQIEKMGYYAWLNDKELVFFKLADNGIAHELHYFKSTDSDSELIDQYIGRTLAIRPENEEILYVSKRDSLNWTLNLFHPDSQKIESLGPTLQNEEDYEWLNHEWIISGKSKGIYIRNINKKDQDWVFIKDLELSQEGSIERIKIDSKKSRIAIVINHKK